MFSKVISAPIAPLTFSYLNNFTRPEGELDWTLSSLGFVLFQPRIPDYSGICGNYTRFIELDAKLIDQIQKTCDRENKSTPSFNYHICLDLTESKLQIIKKAMTTIGLSELEPIERYIAQQLLMKDFAVFIHEESNSAFIFAPSTNIQLYHLCLAFTYTLFPAIFKNKPLSDDEIQVLKSLSHKTADSFISLMQKMLQPVRSVILRTELASCFRGFRQGKISTAENRVHALRSQIEAVLEDYRRKETELENAIVMLEGLKVISDGDSEEEKEVIEYLSKEPRIQNISYDRGSLIFDVTTLLTNTDVKKYENAEKTQGIYDGYRIASTNVFNNKANRMMLMKALFANPNPDLRVKISGHIVFQPSTNWMDAPRGQNIDMTDPILSNCLINPHYKLHGCPGRNRDQIIQCLQQGDLISAIECSIAATGSVNIGETDITFRPFVQEILTSDKRIIQRSDGTDLTPVEALLWLQTKEKTA